MLIWLFHFKVGLRQDVDAKQAEWRNGNGMAEWWNGGIVEWRTEWRNGGMAEWWNGNRMAEWRNGRMVMEWWNGGMVEWQNGGQNGEMVEWRNGRIWRN